MPQPQLRPLQLVALVKDLKDFINLEYELAYYVSTCGLEDKAVDIKSGDPGSNPAGANLFFFFSFFFPWQPLFVLHNSTASFAVSTASSFSEKFKGLYRLGI